jgi:hypothetical protein
VGSWEGSWELKSRVLCLRFLRVLFWVLAYRLCREGSALGDWGFGFEGCMIWVHSVAVGK